MPDFLKDLTEKDNISPKSAAKINYYINQALLYEAIALNVLHINNKYHRKYWSKVTGVILPETNSGTINAIKEYFTNSRINLLKGDQKTKKHEIRNIEIAYLTIQSNQVFNDDITVREIWNLIMVQLNEAKREYEIEYQEAPWFLDKFGGLKWLKENIELESTK